MSNLPLHPAIVHLPIGLSMVLPLVLIALAALWYREQVSRAAWGLGALLSLILAVSSYVALETGEDEEERVEAVVSERAIHEHEEAAEAFFVLSVVVAALSTAALLLPNRRYALIAAGVSSAASLALPVQAVITGHAGGELVYVHNAGAAYATPAAPNAAPNAAPGGEAGRGAPHGGDDHGYEKGKSGRDNGDDD